MASNEELHRAFRSAVSRFYLSDLHVHTPASADVRRTDRIQTLPPSMRDALLGIQDPKTSSLVEYEEQVLRAFPPERFLEALVDSRDKIAAENGLCDGLDWACVGLTDHNVCTYACQVSKAA